MKNPVVLENNQHHGKAERCSVSFTLTASMGLGGGYIPMIVVRRRRFSNVNVLETDTSPCLEAASGGGGGNLPMILEEIEDGTDAT